MTITGDDAVSLVSVIITSVLVTKFAEWVWENYYPFTSNDLSLKVIAFFTYIFVLWFAAWGTLIIVHLFNSMLNQRR